MLFGLKIMDPASPEFGHWVHLRPGRDPNEPDYPFESSDEAFRYMIEKLPHVPQKFIEIAEYREHPIGSTFGLKCVDQNSPKFGKWVTIGGYDAIHFTTDPTFPFNEETANRHKHRFANPESMEIVKS